MFGLFLLSQVQEVTMVADQVTEEAGGATEVVVLGMATREGDLAAAAMEVMEVMMEVNKSLFFHQC